MSPRGNGDRLHSMPSIFTPIEDELFLEVEMQAEEIQKRLHRQRSLLPWGTVRRGSTVNSGVYLAPPNSIQTQSWLLLITQMRLRLRSAWSLVAVPSGRNRSGIDLAKLRTEKELHLRSGRQSLLPSPQRTWAHLEAFSVTNFIKGGDRVGSSR